jgi:ABC-type Zn uptake system ZnuABC Zn-binding protein ZnuA
MREAYTAQLDALEAEVKAAVAEIPADKRVVITSHDAFGYFGHEYGIDFRAPEGVSTESEASAADVARLIEEIREDKASAVFVENVSNPRLIEQIAAETGPDGGRLPLFGRAVRAVRPGRHLHRPDAPQRTHAEGRHSRQLGRRPAKPPAGATDPRGTGAG